MKTKTVEISVEKFVEGLKNGTIEVMRGSNFDPTVPFALAAKHAQVRRLKRLRYRIGVNSRKGYDTTIQLARLAEYNQIMSKATS